MITASANYQAEVSKDSRTFRAQFLASGTALSLDIMALRIFKGTGDGTILPGSIYSSYIECTVLNNAAIVADAELTLQIGLVLTRDPETIEWLTIGKYTISDVSRGYYQTEFTAVSTLSALGGTTYVSTMTFPATTAAIAADVATQMGATVTIDSAFDTTIPVTLKPENYTCRGVLSILAGLLGGFVTEDNLGNVLIKPFNSGGTLAQGTGRVTQDPKYSSAAYTVTGVKCIVSPATEETAEVAYSSTTTVNLTMTNKFMTQDLFDEMETQVVGLTGYGGEVNLALGDPRIEPGDVLSMTDRSGVVRSVPCNTVEIIFDGGVQTNITCVTETDTKTTTTVKGNLTAMAENAQATAEAAQTTAETAQTIATDAQTTANATAQHFWYDSSGVHVSEQAQGATQTDYATITSGGMTITASGADVAAFGADGAQIGNTSDTHLEMDYHSMELIDKEGNTFFHVSDLRDASGNVTLTAEGDGTTDTFLVPFGSFAYANDAVKVDGVAVAFTVSASGDLFVLDTAPASGTTVTITITPDADETKAYTLGIRESDSTVGGMSYAEGYCNVASGYYTHAEGHQTTASGVMAHAEGYQTTASGSTSHAEGSGSTASEGGSHAEGSGSTASGIGSHAEGASTTASGQFSHAEGVSTTASGQFSHAEGSQTTASGGPSHAEGSGSTASGVVAHAEGMVTDASGDYSHAEGYYTTASGTYSHAEGSCTIAASDAQHVQGKFNISDTADNYAHIVGNGTSALRANAYTLDWSGNGQFAGGVYVGATSSGGSYTTSSIGIDATGAANLVSLTTSGAASVASLGVTGAASAASLTLSGSLRFDGQLIKSTSWTESSTINSAYGNIYRSAALTKSISSWGFTSAPKVWLQSTSLQCWVQVTSVSATSITYYLVRGTALNTASSVTLDLLCIGTTS